MLRGRSTAFRVQESLELLDHVALASFSWTPQ